MRADTQQALNKYLAEVERYFHEVRVQAEQLGQLGQAKTTLEHEIVAKLLLAEIAEES